MLQRRKVYWNQRELQYASMTGTGAIGHMAYTAYCNDQNLIHPQEIYHIMLSCEMTSVNW